MQRRPRTQILSSNLRMLFRTPGRRRQRSLKEVETVTCARRGTRDYMRYPQRSNTQETSYYSVVLIWSITRVILRATYIVRYYRHFQLVNPTLFPDGLCSLASLD